MAENSMESLKPKPTRTQSAQAHRSRGFRDLRWLESTPRRSLDVLSRRNHDGSVSVMHIDNESYFLSFDGMASEIWHMIDGRANLKDIIQTLIRKHAPPVQRLNRDVKNFIRKLESEKLIEWVST